MTEDARPPGMSMPEAEGQATPDFEGFFRSTEPALRAALVSTFGSEIGREAAAEALVYAWRNWGRVKDLDNPAGFLFRVGQRWGRRHQVRGRRRVGIPPDEQGRASFEPQLADSLSRLPLRQRQAVVLCIGYGLTHAEAAALLGIKRSSIQNHVERALQHLRQCIGAET